jgi:pyruvate/2-oxoacid:ferredoxin oxidoreductase alpha subunit
MLNVDAFILSHTLMPTQLPTQEETDEYLPLLDLPHRLKFDTPFTIGGLALPRVTAWHRRDMEQDIYTVFDIYKEAQDKFEKVFGHRPEDPVTGYRTRDAEAIIITSSTMCSTARTIVDEMRKKRHKVGMIKIKMYRPFPTDQLLKLIGRTPKIGIIDRNFALGAPCRIGGIFAQDVVSAIQSSDKHPLTQSYIAGIGGLDVTPNIIEEIAQDLLQRERSESSLWKGL